MSVVSGGAYLPSVWSSLQGWNKTPLLLLEEVICEELSVSLSQDSSV